MQLSDLETALISSLKARQPVAVTALRLLISRIKNEAIAKGRNLESAEILAVIQSERKKKSEAASAFDQAGRPAQAGAERAEARVLEQFLPAQLTVPEIQVAIDAAVADKGWTAGDFSKAMKELKAQLGTSCDGATLAGLLKATLK